MAHHPRGSSQLAQQKPHHYQKPPDEDREADKLLEKVVQELMARGLTRAAALKHARHWG